MAHEMKVLLLNPLYRQSLEGRYERYFIRSGSRWPHSGVKLKETIPHYLPFPFSLAYAAAYLKQVFINPYVIDAVALNMPEDVLLQQIGRINPDAVFYEFTTLTIEQDLSLAKKIKKLTQARVIIGGAHAAYFASEIIPKHKEIDFIIRGDYEYVLVDLIQALEKKRPLEIAGVVSLVNEVIVDNGYPVDKDSSATLGVPLREIFPANDRPDPAIYWDGFCQYQPALQLQSSRGCKYSCSFCLNSRAGNHPAKYRVALPGQVCDEIISARERYGIREFYFDDDNFTQDMQHVDGIFQLMRERGQSIKWSAMASFSTLTPEIIHRLADYGCIGLKLGIESANSRVLQGVYKPVDLKNVPGIIYRCYRHRIKTHLTFSIGFLEETQEDINKTFFYARSLACDSIQVSIATPLPGTEFFEQAKRQNLLNNAPWASYDGKRISVIRSLSSDTQTLSKARKNFLRSWFIRKALSPGWWMAHLPIVLRSIAGIGFILCFKQLVAVFIDENKNS
jgi:radical SAM superfamily enzyme YgiQ (UPF0313 family)